MRKLSFILPALILIVAYVYPVPQSFSSDRTDVRGEITNLTRVESEGDRKLLGRALIEGAREPDTKVDKASVTVTSETDLFIKRGDKREPVEFSALKKGQRVEARFTGLVRESYPVQATAAEITILEE